MSLTETEMVFASIHEDVLNDVLASFCTDRPHYLVYRSHRPRHLNSTVKGRALARKFKIWKEIE